MELMGKDRKPLGLLALLAVCAILASAVLAVNADAARGAGKGSGKGGGNPPPPATGTCTATPNPVALGTDVTINGSGFAAKASIGFTLSSSEGAAGGWVITDDTGAFSMKFQPAWMGTNTFAASGGGVSATCTFEVT